MQRKINHLKAAMIISIIVVFNSCLQDNGPSKKFVHQVLMNKEFTYTIETDFIDYNASLNIYSKINKKVFEKKFGRILYIDSVVNETIYLSRYSFTGSPEKETKSVLTKTDTGSLGYQNYNYKIKYLTDNFGGTDTIYNWKFIKFKTDKLIYQDCKSGIEFSIPINHVINNGGELIIKNNIKQGLVFRPIFNCEDVGNRKLNFFDSLILKR